MADLPAEVVVTILQDMAPDALLLRGTASILAGTPQNDIDVFIPEQVWRKGNVFGRHQVVGLRRFGTDQLKVTLREAATGTLAEIDVFHQLTWRGLQLVDVAKLPVHWVDALGVQCLDTSAAAWLTVVKNVLHGSITPEGKLTGVIGQPNYHLVSRAGCLIQRLDEKLNAAAWSAARCDSVQRRDKWIARCSLIGIRVWESPIHSIYNLGRWLFWRIGRQ